MFFRDVKEAKPDPIFGQVRMFLEDPRKEKVNLMIGIYQDDALKAELFPSVKRAKEKAFSEDLIANYLFMDGLPEYTELLGPIVFGNKRWKSELHRIYAAQAVGGTGALRLGAELIVSQVSKVIYVPNHT